MIIEGCERSLPSCRGDCGHAAAGPQLRVRYRPGRSFDSYLGVSERAFLNFYIAIDPYSQVLGAERVVPVVFWRVTTIIALGYEFCALRALEALEVDLHLPALLRARTH